MHFMSFLLWSIMCSRGMTSSWYLFTVPFLEIIFFVNIVVVWFYFVFKYLVICGEVMLLRPLLDLGWCKISASEPLDENPCELEICSWFEPVKGIVS